MHESIDIEPKKRIRIYDYEQIIESFSRYRGKKFYDKESLQTQLEKHFNPELAKKVIEDVAESKKIKTMMQETRESLDRTGHLLKTSPESAIVRKEQRNWENVQVRGHWTKAYAVKVTIKTKKGKVYQEIRYRDTYGRFTSNPG